MNKLMIGFLILTTTLYGSSLSAKRSSQPKSPYPRGCEVTGFSFNENYLVLNETGEQTLYLIQNHSKFYIELEHQETREVFMSPTMKAKFSPLQWSAFASDVADTHFKCYKQDGDSTAMINCSEVLDICQYPRVKFATSNMGNYWVSTNKSQAQIIHDAINKGILLRW